MFFWTTVYVWLAPEAPLGTQCSWMVPPTTINFDTSLRPNVKFSSAENQIYFVCGWSPRACPLNETKWSRRRCADTVWAPARSFLTASGWFWLTGILKSPATEWDLEMLMNCCLGQWRRLHKARGHVPPSTFTNGWARRVTGVSWSTVQLCGTVCRSCYVHRTCHCGH